MNKRGLLILLLLFTSFCSSMPMVRAADPVCVFAEIPNWDPIQKCYGMKRYYLFRVYVWDPDGATDISKVYLNATDDGGNTIFQVRADNLNSTPSYSIGSGADIIDLNVSACNWIEDGEYGWAYFYIQFEWDCPSYDDCGIFLYVEDSNGGSHQEQDRVNYFGIITRLLATNPRFPDSRVNAGGSGEIVGNINYAYSATSNDSIDQVPPVSEVNYIHIHNSSHHSVANTSSMLSTGWFDVTFNIPDAVQLNTYHIYLDIAGDYPDGDTPDGNTATVIGDRYNVTSFWSSNYEPKCSEVFTLYAEFESEYDSHAGSGNDYLVIEGLTFDYDAENDRHYSDLNISLEGEYYFDTLDTFVEGTYGIDSALFLHNITVIVTVQSAGWTLPGSTTDSTLLDPILDGDGIIAPASPYLNLGIVLIVGSVVFALFWKEIDKKDDKALKQFQSRREGSRRSSKEKEKQVPKQFKNRRK